jgi:hypothetical protein
MFNVRSISFKIEKLLEQYEHEELKLKKLQLLNQILQQIKFLETHLEQNYSQVPVSERIKLIQELKIKQHSHKKETEHEYQISFYGKISNFFFSKISEFIIETFPSLTKKTTLLLRGSGLRMLTNTYYSTSLFSTFLLLFIGSAIGTIIFYQSSYIYGLILGPVLAGIAFLTFIFYPNYRFHKRKSELNSEYPFIINYITALSNSRIKNLTIFEILLTTKQKALTPELKKIILYNKVLNYPLHESIQLGTQNLPSNKMQQFFNELSEIYKNHLDPTIFLNKKSHESLIEYETLNKSPFKIFKNLFFETANTIKNLKFNFLEIISIIMGLAIITLAYIYTSIESPLFPIFIITAFIIIWAPIFINSYKSWIANKEKEEQFLLFTKDLNKTKNPLAISNNYSLLDSNIKKFLSQYKLGIPIEKAFDTLAKESRNTLIESSILLALEAKKHNADIYEALENITKSKVIRNILRTEKV